MPSIASHFACGKLVYKELKDDIKNKDDFYIGCALPDIIDCPDSHLKIQGKYYLIPDIEKYKKTTNLNLDFNKGYLCHLLLDKYFLEEYIPENIPSYNIEDIFLPSKIYQDYTNMNSRLVNRYQLNIDYLNKIISESKLKIKKDKYADDLQNLRTTIPGEMNYIDFDRFTKFIEKSSSLISKELSIKSKNHVKKRS